VSALLLPHQIQTTGQEARALLTLAWPIVLAQVGFMFMGVVDTVFAGPLGASPLGALAIGNIAFFGLFVLGSGTLRSLDAYVSQAWGAGRVDDCARGLSQAHWLALVMTPPLAGLILAVPSFLELIGYAPELVQTTREYIVPAVWGLPAGLLFSAYRAFLSGVNVTLPIMFAAVAANLCNLGLDWLLIDGKLGAPALGVVGISWATSACRFVMFGVLALTVALHSKLRSFPTVWRAPEPALMRKLTILGLPVGLAVFAEVGAFGSVGVLMGLKGAIPLAAHQIALNATALLFMVPLGLSSGAAVRCGQALGAGDPDAVERSGRTALLVGVAYAAVSASTLWFLREPIAALYGVTGEVLSMAVVFLGVASCFQLVDVLQVLSNGILRGLGDTRIPFLFTIIGYVVLGIPLGALGAFVLDDDPLWLWWGLTLGLAIVAMLGMARFHWQVRRLRAGLPPRG